MLVQQFRQTILSLGNSRKEEHNLQKEGKKISSASFVYEGIFFRRFEIKKFLSLLFPGN